MPRTKIAADKLRNMQQSKTANDKLLSKQQTNIADEKLRSKQQQLARRREHYAANSAAILEQQRKRQRPIIRRCVVCGKEFDNRKGAKTCSPEHLKEYRRVCDHEYYLANQEKWVVSDRKRRAKRSPKIRQCVVCGKDFVVVSGKENTCSLEHRHERLRMTERARYTADLEKHRVKARAKARLRRLEAKAPLDTMR